MRIWSLVWVFSTLSANFSSWSLRPYVCSVASRMPSWSSSRLACSMSISFTYCCVIEDPPWVSPDAVLETRARIVPRTSIPPCS